MQLLGITQLLIAAVKFAVEDGNELLRHGHSPAAVVFNKQTAGPG
ncbi:hypothetical protein ACFS3C_19060 [Azotobacter vinelandii]